jgi:hypothetical protein
MNALLRCMKKEMSTSALVNAPLSIRARRARTTVTCQPDSVFRPSPLNSEKMSASLAPECNEVKE